ncbi:hypothetical protein RvY_17125 [Ramazzottius varieornatus]|uniref:Uncharacterized protein n=1 Tax=Ramazzottius varieornatus TaxID=947166 RepID=A0A1D1W1X8_RAMVA|nr:hypothetical protein RvY_17125 [Ramazzottius varieornatus]
MSFLQTVFLACWCRPKIGAFLQTNSYTLSSKLSTRTDFSSESVFGVAEKPKSLFAEDANPQAKENPSKLRLIDPLPLKNVQGSASSNTAFRRSHLVNTEASSLIPRPRAISLTQSQMNSISRINHPDIHDQINVHTLLTEIPSLFGNFASTSNTGGEQGTGPGSMVTTPALRSTDFPEELIYELQAESQRRLAEKLTSTMGFQFDRTSTPGHNGDREKDNRSERLAKYRRKEKDKTRDHNRRSKVDIREKPSAPEMTVLASSHDLDKYFSSRLRHKTELLSVVLLFV